MSWVIFWLLHEPLNHLIQSALNRWLQLMPMELQARMVSANKWSSWLPNWCMKQCDQVWQFFKVLRDKFTYKSCQIFEDFVGILKTSVFQVKIAVVTFWGNFIKNWATFYFIIWSHCQWAKPACWLVQCPWKQMAGAHFALKTAVLTFEKIGLLFIFTVDRAVNTSLDYLSNIQISWVVWDILIKISNGLD